VGDVRPDHERGEISIRVVVVAAVVAALAWSAPFVLFGRQQTDRIADLTGGSTPPPTAGAGTGQPPVDPIGRANDAQARATLNNAALVAQVHFAENGSYTGFGAEVASAYDPSVTFTSGPAAPGVVSIRGVTPTTVVFVTTTANGAYLCAAAQADVVTFGRANALAPSQCSGGW
jgi:hypothetical protein